MSVRRISPLLTCLFLVPVLSGQTVDVQRVDRLVDSVLETFEVPGAAVTIVQDGKVLLAKGYGVKDMKKQNSVDEKTIFAIASNSKAFTATALGILVEEGKLEWDAPVIRYLPWFRLSDPYVTTQMTIRDLLVHRSGLGLGAGDLLWWPPSTYNREQIARRLQYIPLATSFRSAYAYDNVLYLVAGLVIEEISGVSWEEFITQRILKPLEMTDSHPGHSDIEKATNAATPHARVEGAVRPVSAFTSDNTNPAGGIVASARDMAKWMIVQLDSGRVGGSARLFTPATARNLWSFVTPLFVGNPPSSLAPLRANFRGYGLGFVLNDYRGVKLVSHTGGLPGFLSKVSMIPERKIGVSVLTNQESGAAFSALSYALLDMLLGYDDTPWVKAYKDLVDQQQAAMAKADAGTAGQRDAETKPSLPLASYMGTYEDAWYGTVTLSMQDGKTIIRFDHTPSLVGDLEHWQYDTFVARWHDRELRADAFVTFSLEPDGSIRDVRMKAVSPSTDFSFDFHDLLLRPRK